MEDKYLSPYVIENVIIDVKPHSHHDFDYIKEVLGKFSIRVMQLRFFGEFNFGLIVSVLTIFKAANIESIEVIVSDLFKHIQLQKIVKASNKLTSLYLFNSSRDRTLTQDQCIIVFVKESVMGSHSCGKVSHGNLTCNKSLFYEAQHINTCLNKKISIDSAGQVKNCPSMIQTFGRYDDVDFSKLINSDEYKLLWNITKDEISVCKDCEYRYMCTDCRVFLSEPSNIYSKPSKCSYNPYLGLWRGDDGWISSEDWLKEK